MKKNINRFKKRFFDDTFKQIGALGSYQFHAIILIMFFLAKLYSEFIFLLIGYFVMKAFVIPLRLVFFESRPEAEEYTNIFEKISASSFPSLHATRIVFLFLFLVEFFNRDIAIIFFLSGILIVTLYSRIYLKRHYPIDVVFGATIGVIIFFILKIFFII
jgi:membrane-associated phospholipid phosphatase